MPRPSSTYRANGAAVTPLPVLRHDYDRATRRAVERTQLELQKPARRAMRNAYLEHQASEAVEERRRAAASDNWVPPLNPRFRPRARGA